MRCTLLIPHLWWSRGAGDDAYRELRLPHLQRFMACARREAFTALGWEAWLCQAFEVERQVDWPIAPLTLMVDGIDPGDAYWLRADPVHLRAHRDRLLLADSSVLQLRHDEAFALVAALNRHFAEDGLQFTAPHAERWYLRLDRGPGIETLTIDEAAGGFIDGCLPAGASAMQWHRLLNEAQMLLHDAAVNEAREARGALPANGVWLWGGGYRTAVPGRHFSSVVADEPLAIALAASADIASESLPAAAAPWLHAQRKSAENHVLIVLDGLTGPSRRGDLDAWRAALETLDARWIDPLVEALKRGQLTGCALVAPGSTGCERFELSRGDLYRFWRRTHSVAHYLPHARASRCPP